ncbi:MAG: vWA domain-containing protein [Bacteroidota bacterium]
MRSLISLLIIILFSLFVVSCSKDALTEVSTVPGGTYTDALSSSSGAGGSTGGSGSSSNPGGQAGVITAGEWNDLANWDFWTKVLQRDTIKTFPAAWGFYTDNRVSVLLKDASGKLLHDAVINLTTDGTTIKARTDNFGKAELFPGLHDAGISLKTFSLTAEYNNQSFSLGSFNASQTDIVKTIPINKINNNTLDVAFVVDATGSMGDEIIYLKNELFDVVNRAGAQLAGKQIRMGSVFYRDIGDDYVTRPFPFTSDPASLVSFIKDQEANGGGDFPEAADQGLETAIENLQWSDHAINRILFLILDAPPHDGQEQLERIKKVVAEAQQKGIRIIPISASGIDRSTEFILRFLSVSTNSTYVFITNDSGIGNPHLIATVGNYTVEYLNNLMVRLITKYGQNND